MRRAAPHPARSPARRPRAGFASWAAAAGAGRVAVPGWGLRLWAALLWAALAVAVLPASSAAQAIRMATAFEVCGSFGARKVDSHGEPVPAHEAHAAHHHDCCITPTLGLPSAEAVTPAASSAGPAPATALTAARLGSEWLAPLSRGPPART